MIRMDEGSRSFAPIFIIALLLLGAVYFALAETAFASVNRIRIKTRAERGSNRAERHCMCWTILTKRSQRS